MERRGWLMKDQVEQWWSLCKKYKPCHTISDLMRWQWCLFWAQDRGSSTTVINSQALKRTGGKYKSKHGHEELYTPAGIFARLEMQAKFKSDQDFTQMATWIWIIKSTNIVDSHKDLQAELLISLGPGFCHRKCIGGTFTILPFCQIEIEWACGTHPYSICRL